MPRSKWKKEAGLPVIMRPVPKGRPVDLDVLAAIAPLVDGEAAGQPLLIEQLHRLQDHFGHLTTDHLNALAHHLGLTQAEVYEVATFYHHFDIVREGEEAPPAVTVRVCGSLSCELAGSRPLLEALRERVGSGVRVIEAPCIGRCDVAPAAFVGWRPVPRADAEILEALAEAHDTEAVLPDYEDYEAYRAAGGYARLDRFWGAGTPSGDRETAVAELMEAVDAAGLRGMGGAGFPAARKWGFVRAEPKPRAMALNADEGEPGTFKDRWCLEREPHRVLEGLLLAAAVVEAEDVYIYLRDEYPAIREVLERELPKLRQEASWQLPRLHLRRGAGAYICGEETGLIESVEGKRGEPRLRPPFPAQVGVFGRPTLVHNVETMYWIPEILERGAAWFAGAGARGGKGVRLFSISGRVARPGVYQAPNGATARELIELAGGMAEGHELYGYLPGGASGGILPARLADVPLDFGSLAEHGCFVGSGAVMVLSRTDSARAAALNVMRFFAHESCGKCTPCRVGTSKAVTLMERERWDTDLLRELSETMADASICGLGQAAPNPVLSVLRFFADELGTGGAPPAGRAASEGGEA